MGCSICGAEGATKQTCPFNPGASNPKPRKHNASPLKASPKPVSGMAVAVKPPVKKIKAVIKRPAEQDQSKSKLKPRAAGIDLDTVSQEAKRLFPGDQATQQQYVADLLSMDMPRAPTDDIVSKAAKQKQRKIQEKKAMVADRCARCLQAVRARGLVKDHQWFGVSQVCEECHRGIGDLYHNTDVKDPYRTYHRGAAVPVDQLVSHGAKDGYYNGTMYEGAKFWANAAARRAASSLPSVPIHKPWQAGGYPGAAIQDLYNFVNLVSDKADNGLPLHGRRRVLRQLGNDPGLSDLQNEILQWVHTAQQLNDPEVKAAAQRLLPALRANMPADNDLQNIQLIRLRL